MFSQEPRIDIVCLVILLFLSAGIRFYLVAFPLAIPDPDEAVVGLMAKHILEGRHYPLFYYGQAYLGSLEAYLVAASFNIFGYSAIVLRIPAIVSACLLVLLAYRLARLYSHWSISLACASLIATGPPIFVKWSLKARGGFVESLLLAMLIFYLIAKSWQPSQENEYRHWFIIGCLAGILFWTNQLFAGIVPWILFAIYLKNKRNDLPVRIAFSKKAGIYISGFFLGSAPFWIFNIKEGGVTFHHLFLYFQKKNALDTGLFTGIWNLNVKFFSSFLPQILGGPVDAGAISIVSYVIYIIILSVSIIGLISVYQVSRSTFLLAIAFLVLLLPGFMQEVRYTFFLYMPVILVSCYAVSIFNVKSLNIMIIVLVSLALYFIIVTSVYIRSEYNAKNIQEAFAYLENEEMNYGYSDYDTAYILTFLSKEKIIVSPMGAIQGRLDRYPLHTEMVRRSPHPFFIFRRGSYAAEQFRSFLKDSNIQAHEVKLDNYIIWKDLSRPVYPQ